MEQLEIFKESLRSAKLVQEGLLPKDRHFKKLFQDYFVLYKPENLVSGDFYWIGYKDNLTYLVVGDCTGHGIGAALLSVMGINLFEYAIMNKGIKKTNKILKEVDKKFIESFKNTENSLFSNPWIDLSIVCIDEKINKLYFSSANRKLLYVNSNKEFTIYKGSRYPIGGWQIEKNRSFTSKEINFNKGDVIYLGSDGFQDQFGGIKDKKYRSAKLHKFLASNSSLPLIKQKEELENEFNNWAGNNHQTDDICIMGVRLS